MTAIDPATCWAPVPVRWRYVQRAEVIVGRAGELLRVVYSDLADDGRSWMVTVAQMVSGPDALWAGPVDPDELVQVLVPIPERDAQRLSVEQLGAVVVGRRMGGAA